MLKRISDKEIGLLEWESATLDMSFADDYKDEVVALLQAQLEADQRELDEAQQQTLRGVGKLLLFTHKMCIGIGDYLEFANVVKIMAKAFKQGKMPK